MTGSKSDSKAITPTEAGLVVLYIVIALGRQVTHDVRSILRWLRVV